MALAERPARRPLGKKAAPSPYPKKFEAYPEELQKSYKKYYEKYKEVKAVEPVEAAEDEAADKAAEEEAAREPQKLVAYSCSFIPTELIAAAGAVPLKIDFKEAAVDALLSQKDPDPEAEAEPVEPLQVDDPALFFADAVLVNASCEGKKQLCDKLSAVKPVCGIELPKDFQDTEAFAAELAKARSFLEEKLELTITEDQLHEAIKQTNAERAALAEFMQLEKIEPSPVLGSKLAKLAELPCTIPDAAERTEEVKNNIELYKDAYRRGICVSPDFPRVLVTGCLPAGTAADVVAAVEDSRLSVVMLDASRSLLADDMIAEDGDALAAIAGRYLAVAARGHAADEEKAARVGKLMDDYDLDGVVEVYACRCAHCAGRSEAVEKCVADRRAKYFYLDAEADAYDNKLALEAFAKEVAENKAALIAEAIARAEAEAKAKAEAEAAAAEAAAKAEAEAKAKAKAEAIAKMKAAREAAAKN